MVLLDVYCELCGAEIYNPLDRVYHGEVSCFTCDACAEKPETAPAPYVPAPPTRRRLVAVSAARPPARRSRSGVGSAAVLLTV